MGLGDLPEARTAAGVAAKQVAIASIAGLARRIGRLEERGGPPYLPQPDRA